MLLSKPKLNKSTPVETIQKEETDDLMINDGCRSELLLDALPQGGGVLRSSFVGYVLLASQNPYTIIVYSVANYRPHLRHFWANVTVISRTEFKANRLLNINTTAGTIF